MVIRRRIAVVAQKTLAAVIGSQPDPRSKLFDELGLSGSDVTSSSGHGSLSRLSSGSFLARAALRSDPLRGSQAVELGHQPWDVATRPRHGAAAI